jgi:hypothetical protein
MPQDSPRTETHRTEQQRSGSTRAEQMRGENTAAAETFTAQIGDMGKRSIHAGLRMQTEMFDALQAISRDWVACATSEAELALNLPGRLAGARTMPEAVAAYQEWLNEWVMMCNEDGRRLAADGQKFMTSGVRCFTSVSASAPN